MISGQAIPEQDSPLKAALGRDAYTRCGLDRLSPEQLDLLATHLAPPPMDYVGAAAVAYLQRDGWLVVEPLGAGTTPPLAPGTYLGKVTGFHLEVIDLFGEARRYSIEERI